ncbi:citrate synthase [Longirhabdus pacifica]|uniref:citrate synthase n=1 Tax=Longirhabdus pacifica TaxID=2305227 RepID=UPI001008B3CB|nr:citrate synthase [Longirhabdus pacifica]
MTTQKTFAPGLEGVIAAETNVSFLDVEAEEIVIRGYDLIELANKKQYLDVAYLLIHGDLPSNEEKKALQKELQGKYHLPSYVSHIFNSLPKQTNMMDALRTGISVLAHEDETLEDHSETAIKQKAYDLLAKIPTIIADSYHIVNGNEPIKPDASLSYSANFLYMMTGNVPTDLEEEIFDQLLTAYIEHEMPNSTFTARVISSTLSDIYGALTGAVASLKGTLHGGANEAVMYMLLEAKTPENFEKLIRAKLANKEKIMGFGHRVYMKKMDPRALLMKEALKRLVEVKGNEQLLTMCELGEDMMRNEKGLYPNLDYYAAPVYYLLGVPIELYTPVFFSSRAAGLSAHILEQHSNNRIFRPRVNYLGKRGLHPTTLS